MENIEPTEAWKQDAQPVYKEICQSYRAIDDFRGKLLGFLPLATGTGIFLLLGDVANIKVFFMPIGAFGLLITAGLFAFELFGIKKCGALIDAGRTIEKSLGFDAHGQFSKRPDADSQREDHAAYITLNEPFASGIIYPAVLAAWSYVTFADYQFVRGGDVSPLVSALVFLIGFISTLAYDYGLRKDVWAREKGKKST